MSMGLLENMLRMFGTCHVCHTVKHTSSTLHRLIISDLNFCVDFWFRICSTEVKEDDYVLLMNGRYNIPAVVQGMDHENQVLHVKHFKRSKQKLKSRPDAVLYDLSVSTKGDHDEVTFTFMFSEVVLKLPEPTIHQISRHRSHYEFQPGKDAYGT